MEAALQAQVFKNAVALAAAAAGVTSEQWLAEQERLVSQSMAAVAAEGEPAGGAQAEVVAKDTGLPPSPSCPKEPVQVPAGAAAPEAPQPPQASEALATGAQAEVAAEGSAGSQAPSNDAMAQAAVAAGSQQEADKAAVVAGPQQEAEQAAGSQGPQPMDDQPQEQPQGPQPTDDQPQEPAAPQEPQPMGEKPQLVGPQEPQLFGQAAVAAERPESETMATLVQQEAGSHGPQVETGSPAATAVAVEAKADPEPEAQPKPEAPPVSRAALPVIPGGSARRRATARSPTPKAPRSAWRDRSHRAAKVKRDKAAEEARCLRVHVLFLQTRF